MRLAICVNHSYPHVGGSEKVVQQISESCVSLFGYTVKVFSNTVGKSSFQHNNVLYENCSPSFEGFLKQLEAFQADHLFVYSDCFMHWDKIVANAEKIKATKSIALVGMNHMRDLKRSWQVFYRNHKNFKVITHSDNYLDYLKCSNSDIPIHVIPNGIDLDEFSQNLEKENIVLCVANFFPGKGQSHLVKILDKLYEKHQDFKAVFLFSSVNFAFSKMLETLVRKQLEKSKFKHMCLVDLPRKEVVDFFQKASVFAFPSLKEVAPLVVLEAQASRTPWVSLPVGNVKELSGGIIVPPAAMDAKGYYGMSESTYEAFSDAVLSLLVDKEKAKTFGNRGRAEIEDKFNWNVIAHMYHKVFTDAS